MNSTGKNITSVGSSIYLGTAF